MPLQLVLREVDPSCHESEDGFASVIVGGGTPPYTLSWLDEDDTEVSTASSARGLGDGEYRVIVNDSAGLTGSGTVTIVNPAYQDPITEIGMRLCELNCFLKIASCQAGNLGYKYFVQQPNDGIECKQKQMETIWLLNAIDTLNCWKPEDTEIECGILAEFIVPYPTMSCSVLGSSMTIDAYLVSSVDGTIAYYHADPTVASGYAVTITQSFYTQINALENYSATLDPLAPFSSTYIGVTANGTQYNDSTITLYVVITNLVSCTINGGQGFVLTADGGVYSNTPQVEEVTHTSSEPCLTPEQAGVMIEKIKELIGECNVKNLSKDLSAT